VQHHSTGRQEANLRSTSIQAYRAQTVPVAVQDAAPDFSVCCHRTRRDLQFGRMAEFTFESCAGRSACGFLAPGAVVHSSDSPGAMTPFARFRNWRYAHVTIDGSTPVQISTPAHRHRASGVFRSTSWCRRSNISSTHTVDVTSVPVSTYYFQTVTIAIGRNSIGTTAAAFSCKYGATVVLEALQPAPRTRH